jgi:hypothetical protein
MSIANLKDTGNQGNNMPWQWNVLKGLQGIIDQLQQQLSADVTIVSPIGQLNNAKSIPVTLSSDQESLKITPVIIREQLTASSISDDCYSISFASVGTVAALISFDSGANYVSIAPGTTINMDAGGLNNYYAKDTFYYDTTSVGSILIITYNI